MYLYFMIRICVCILRLVFVFYDLYLCFYIKICIFICILEFVFVFVFYDLYLYFIICICWLNTENATLYLETLEILALFQ